MGKNVKIVTFVPAASADILRQALGNAGAGNLGNYTHCSHSVDGKGRFTPQTGTDPYLGSVGKAETVDEERIEVVCEYTKAKQVIAALRAVHPYEEVAFDTIPLLDEDELPDGGKNL